MQILISLLPFQNLRAYLKFQKLDEGDHRETKLSSKFPRIVDIKKPSFFKIPRLTDNLTSQELVELLFTRRRHVLTLQYLFHKSYSMFTSDMRLVFPLVIYKLDSCKNTSPDSCKSFIKLDSYHLLYV